MDLLRIKRLIDSDTKFAWRVEAACRIGGHSYNPEILWAVAASDGLLDAVTMDPESLIVNSEKVSDDSIIAAVEGYFAQPAATSGKA